MRHDEASKQRYPFNSFPVLEIFVHNPTAPVSHEESVSSPFSQANDIGMLIGDHLLFLSDDPGSHISTSSLMSAKQHGNGEQHQRNHEYIINTYQVHSKSLKYSKILKATKRDKKGKDFQFPGYRCKTRNRNKIK